MAAGQEALRVVAPDEALHGERLWELMDRVFPEGTGADCRDGRIAHSHYDWQTSRIGLVGDRVVAHFGVYDLSMRVGSATVRTAGVNLVGTHPDFRRRGYMDAVTRASLEAMRENGYALSLICNGVPNLYGRYGYVFAWPETAWTVKTEDLPAYPSRFTGTEEGAATPPARDADLPRGDSPIELTEFAPGGRPELWVLYNRWHDGVTGTAVRPTFLRTKTPNSPDRGFMAMDFSGQLAAYVVVDRTSDGKTLWLEDAAGDPGLLVFMLAKLAREWGCEALRVTRQPFAGPLVSELRKLRCREESRYEPDGGWMVRVIDPLRLLTALAPELSLRLRRSALSTWEGRLAFGGRQGDVTLDVHKGEVRVGPADRRPGFTIVVDHPLAQLAIGAIRPEELISDEQVMPFGADMLICALFPYQQPMMSNGDI